MQSRLRARDTDSAVAAVEPCCRNPLLICRVSRQTLGSAISHNSMPSRRKAQKCALFHGIPFSLDGNRGLLRFVPIQCSEYLGCGQPQVLQLSRFASRFISGGYGPDYSHLIFWIFNTVVDATSQLILACVPIYILYDLQLSWTKKRLSMLSFTPVIT